MRTRKMPDVRNDDFKSFFRSWLKDPLSIGAVAPSGKLLGRKMAAGIGPGARIVELGAGTGTLTRALLNNGVRVGDLFLVEQDAGFAALLRRRFPSCKVIQADATRLDAHLGELAGTFDFVISGLPLLLFPVEQKTALLEQAFRLLKPDGELRQFTYAGRCPVGRGLRSQLRLDTALVGFTPFNLPPAFVYRFDRA